MGERRVPVIVPDFAAGGLVVVVEGYGCAGVEFSKECDQGFGVGRGLRDEVVMVGEDGPGFQSPVVVSGK